MKDLVKPRKLVTVDDAGIYLGVSRRTVERFVESGQLKTFRLPDPRGGSFLDRTLIKIDELDRLIETGVEI